MRRASLSQQAAGAWLPAPLAALAPRAGNRRDQSSNAVSTVPGEMRAVGPAPGAGRNAASVVMLAGRVRARTAAVCAAQTTADACIALRRLDALVRGIEGSPWAADGMGVGMVRELVAAQERHRRRCLAAKDGAALSEWRFALGLRGLPALPPAPEPAEPACALVSALGSAALAVADASSGLGASPAGLAAASHAFEGCAACLAAAGVALMAVAAGCGAAARPRLAAVMAERHASLASDLGRPTWAGRGGSGAELRAAKDAARAVVEALAEASEAVAGRGPGSDVDAVPGQRGADGAGSAAGSASAASWREWAALGSLASASRLCRALDGEGAGRLAAAARAVASSSPVASACAGSAVAACLGSGEVAVSQRALWAGEGRGRRSSAGVRDAASHLAFSVAPERADPRARAWVLSALPDETAEHDGLEAAGRALAACRGPAVSHGAEGSAGSAGGPSPGDVWAAARALDRAGAPVGPADALAMGAVAAGGGASQVLCWAGGGGRWGAAVRSAAARALASDPGGRAEVGRALAAAGGDVLEAVARSAAAGGDGGDAALLAGAAMAELSPAELEALSVAGASCPAAIARTATERGGGEEEAAALAVLAARACEVAVVGSVSSPAGQVAWWAGPVLGLASGAREGGRGALASAVAASPAAAGPAAALAAACGAFAPRREPPSLSGPRAVVGDRPGRAGAGASAAARCDKLASLAASAPLGPPSDCPPSRRRGPVPAPRVLDLLAGALLLLPAPAPGDHHSAAVRSACASACAAAASVLAEAASAAADTPGSAADVPDCVGAAVSTLAAAASVHPSSARRALACTVIAGAAAAPLLLLDAVLAVAATDTSPGAEARELLVRLASARAARQPDAPAADGPVAAPPGRASGAGATGWEDVPPPADGAEAGRRAAELADGLCRAGSADGWTTAAVAAGAALRACRLLGGTGAWAGAASRVRTELAARLGDASSGRAAPAAVLAAAPATPADAVMFGSAAELAAEAGPAAAGVTDALMAELARCAAAAADGLGAAGPLLPSALPRSTAADPDDHGRDEHWRARGAAVHAVTEVDALLCRCPSLGSCPPDLDLPTPDLLRHASPDARETAAAAAAGPALCGGPVAPGTVTAGGHIVRAAMVPAGDGTMVAVSRQGHLGSAGGWRPAQLEAVAAHSAVVSGAASLLAAVPARAALPAVPLLLGAAVSQLCSATARFRAVLSARAVLDAVGTAGVAEWLAGAQGPEGEGGPRPGLSAAVVTAAASRLTSPLVALLRRYRPQGEEEDCAEAEAALGAASRVARALHACLRGTGSTIDESLWVRRGSAGSHGPGWLHRLTARTWHDGGGGGGGGGGGLAAWGPAAVSGAGLGLLGALLRRRWARGRARAAWGAVAPSLGRQAADAECPASVRVAAASALVTLLQGAADDEAAGAARPGSSLALAGEAGSEAWWGRGGALGGVTAACAALVRRLDGEGLAPERAAWPVAAAVASEWVACPALASAHSLLALTIAAACVRRPGWACPVLCASRLPEALLAVLGRWHAWAGAAADEAADPGGGAAAVRRAVREVTGALGDAATGRCVAAAGSDGVVPSERGGEEGEVEEAELGGDAIDEATVAALCLGASGAAAATRCRYRLCRVDVSALPRFAELGLESFGGGAASAVLVGREAGPRAVADAAAACGAWEGASVPEGWAGLCCALWAGRAAAEGAPPPSEAEGDMLAAAAGCLADTCLDGGCGAGTAAAAGASAAAAELAVSARSAGGAGATISAFTVASEALRAAPAGSLATLAVSSEAAARLVLRGRPDALLAAAGVSLAAAPSGPVDPTSLLPVAIASCAAAARDAAASGGRPQGDLPRLVALLDAACALLTAATDAAAVGGARRAAVLASVAHCAVVADLPQALAAALVWAFPSRDRCPQLVVALLAALHCVADAGPVGAASLAAPPSVRWSALAAATKAVGKRAAVTLSPRGQPPPRGSQSPLRVAVSVWAACLSECAPRGRHAPAPLARACVEASSAVVAAAAANSPVASSALAATTGAAAAPLTLACRVLDARGRAHPRCADAAASGLRALALALHAVGSDSRPLCDAVLSARDTSSDSRALGRVLQGVGAADGTELPGRAWELAAAVAASRRGALALSSSPDVARAAAAALAAGGEAGRHARLAMARLGLE